MRIARTHNSHLAKKRVHCLIEALCFVSSSVLADSLVLRNPLLHQAPKRPLADILENRNGNKKNKPMKKVITLLFLTINLLCFSQENCEEMTVKNDEVTEKSTISSERFEFENFSLKITAGTRKGSYPIVIFKANNGCIDEYQPIYILLENDKRIKTANYVYGFNCDGFTGFIINSGTNEKLLANETIKTIRIDTRTSFYQVDLTSEKAELIKKAFQCAFDRKSWQEKIKYKGNL